ncbi:hypothetical protein CRE_31180 [Caenorhabditis remanei]|uniref:Uncharacterized protein n=1 Tax=Caenorhabditis remanei TaxID=31234 RepID=E3MLG0_CAERE|nr:hypothetical protein CRE_31180 [Caenorhabditis remanei]
MHFLSCFVAVVAIWVWLPSEGDSARESASIALKVKSVQPLKTSEMGKVEKTGFILIDYRDDLRLFNVGFLVIAASTLILLLVALLYIEYIGGELEQPLLALLYLFEI